MSQKYPGGFITKTPTAPTSSAAPGIWTLDQAMQNQKAGNWPSPPSPYIEDFFSTYLYTGTGATQTITNGIDLSTKGGLVWAKARSSAFGHALFDTVRGSSSGNSKRLISNSTAAAQTTNEDWLTFNANGFTANNDPGGGIITTNGTTYASWTFAERQKFFDIVTYTGNSTARTIAHNLGSAPGCIIVKKTNSTGQWCVYHRGLTSAAYGIFLNLSDAQTSDTALWNSTAPTSSVFSLGTSTGVNNSGDTYVAYLFAHDAGGFGLTGSDNVISCGSVTTTSGIDTVNLGYEPQWLLMKQSNGIDDWWLVDNMRGWSQTGYQRLLANSTDAEATIASNYINLTSTGFTVEGSTFGSGRTYIYIAIRRGPMKVPTDGTKVFNPTSTSGTTGTQITTNFPLDWQILGINAGNVNNQRVSTRLTGVNTDGTSNSQFLITSSTAAEAATGSVTLNWGSTGFQVPSVNSGSPIITWNFRRAPSFFDEVCYTGNGTAGLSVSHNLTVPPEMVIVKRRNSTGDWPVLMRNVDRLGSAGSSYRVNSTASWDPAGVYFSDSSGTFVPATDATSTVFKVSNATAVNASAGTYVAYLFATCAGVSKVGSYTGTGTTLQVNCGFTAGSRFVLIKRADASGDWYVWDSARGIVAGNDPYLLLNSTAAEVTGTDYVDTYNAGFELSSTAPAALNANGGTYIFLAIA